MGDVRRVDGGSSLALPADGRVVAVNIARRVVLHRFAFKGAVTAMRFSPDGAFLAVALGRKMQVWRAPGLDREFSPFVHHRTYTGHFDTIVDVNWSPNSRFLVTASRDMTARIYSLHPLPGFIPVTLTAHRDWLLTAVFAAEDAIHTLSRDGTLVTWVWVELPAAAGGAPPARAAAGPRADDTSEAADTAAAVSAASLVSSALGPAAARAGGAPPAAAGSSTHTHVTSVPSRDRVWMASSAAKTAVSSQSRCAVSVTGMKPGSGCSE